MSMRRVSSWNSSNTQSNEAALRSCVQSLQKSNASLTKGISTLNSTISDFARLQKVVNNERSYDLVTVAEIKSAQFALATEIEPQIKRLIHLAETAVNEMQARFDTAQAKKRQLQAIEAENQEIARLDKELERLLAEKESLVIESENLDLELSRRK